VRAQPPPAARVPDHYRPPAPLMPRDRIEGDFIARALAVEPPAAEPMPDAEPRRDIAMPRFAPQGLMSLGRKPE
jgi:hypothetical protein